MRRAPLGPLATAVSALVLAGAVGGSAFAVQAVGLRRPSEADLAAAKVLRHLLRFRGVASVQHLPGAPPARAVCLQGWYRRSLAGRARRGALVDLGNGVRLLELRRHVRVIGSLGGHDARAAGLGFALAGCPRALGQKLLDRLVHRERVDRRDGSFLGRPAVRFRLGTSRERIDLYVARRTYLPLGIRARAHGLEGWSTVQLRRAAPISRELRARRP